MAGKFTGLDLQLSNQAAAATTSPDVRSAINCVPTADIAFMVGVLPRAFFPVTNIFSYQVDRGNVTTLMFPDSVSLAALRKLEECKIVEIQAWRGPQPGNGFARAAEIMSQLKTEYPGTIIEETNKYHWQIWKLNGVMPIEQARSIGLSVKPTADGENVANAVLSVVQDNWRRP